MWVKAYIWLNLTTPNNEQLITEYELNTDLRSIADDPKWLPVIEMLDDFYLYLSDQFLLSYRKFR